MKRELHYFLGFPVYCFSPYHRYITALPVRQKLSNLTKLLNQSQDQQSQVNVQTVLTRFRQISSELGLI